jgi:hypothetical protein
VEIRYFVQTAMAKLVVKDMDVFQSLPKGRLFVLCYVVTFYAVTVTGNSLNEIKKKMDLWHN